MLFSKSLLLTLCCKMLLNMYENSIYLHFYLFSIYITFSLGSGKGKKTFMQHEQPTLKNMLKYETGQL